MLYIFVKYLSECIIIVNNLLRVIIIIIIIIEYKFLTSSGFLKKSEITQYISPSSVIFVNSKMKKSKKK